MTKTKNRCNRHSCNTIHGEHYTNVLHTGTICEECKEEFKRYLEHENLEGDRIHESTILQKLKYFMINIPKGRYPVDPRMSVDQFFERHTV